jgi:hypothetical protein
MEVMFSGTNSKLIEFLPEWFRQIPGCVESRPQRMAQSSRRVAPARSKQSKEMEVEGESKIGIKLVADSCRKGV